MTTHQQKVLRFLLSPAAAEMSRQQISERIAEIKGSDWKEHLKKLRPDGSCRAGCPMHP